MALLAPPKTQSHNKKNFLPVLGSQVRAASEIGESMILPALQGSPSREFDSLFQQQHTLKHRIMLEKVVDGFTALPFNWDADGAEQLDQLVINNAHGVLAYLPDSTLLLLSHHDIYPASHGTIIFDWQGNNGDQLILEVGIEVCSYRFWKDEQKPSGHEKFSPDDFKVLNKLMKDVLALYQ